MRIRILLSIAVGVLCLSASAQARKQTALDRYISLPDTNYQYRLVNTPVSYTHLTLPTILRV